MILKKFFGLQARQIKQSDLEGCVYPNDRKMIVKAALQCDPADLCLAALEMLPYPEEKDVFLSVVEQCEEKLRENQQSETAAAILISLYRKLDMGKTVLNEHDSHHVDDTTTHSDISHEDEGDPLPGSGNHNDFNNHSDGVSFHEDRDVHDDYYSITSKES